MNKYVRLHYYDCRGEAEVLRLLFKVANVKFEDKRYTEEEWNKAKVGFKIKDLPLVENSDGRLLTENLAIARYFSFTRGLMGTSDWEYYMIEKCIEHIDEASQLLNNVVYKNVTLDENQLFALTDSLKILNKVAEINKSGYLVGKTASLADVCLLVLLDYADMRAGKEYFTKHKKLLDVKKIMLKTYAEVNTWITTMRPITDS